TECVPASIMACTSESALRALFGTPPNTSRRTLRHGSNYQTAPTVSSFFYAALSLGGQSLIVVCNRQIEDAVPEHSTFSKNRHGRFRESETFRHVFETVLQRCMNEGLVGGEGFAIDASVVKADAARATAISGVDIDSRAWGPERASRAVREYLEGIEAEGRPEAQRKSLSTTDPAAEWTCAPGGPPFFAYSTNYLVDVRYGVIVDVEATSAHRTQEVDAT